jgi:cardiolipin synthase
MHMGLIASTTVSVGFLVVAYLAIGAAALVIFIELFGPVLSYKISRTNTDDNTSDEFLHVLESLSDSKIHRGTSLTVLTNGDHFYQDELYAIAQARQSINLEAYIFQDGEIGRQYREALTERAKAGVKVNVVLDALGSAGANNRYFAALTQAGGNLGWYNGLKWDKLPRVNHRTHRELLIIDGQIAFVGGAGVADHWYKGKGKDPRWRDTMVRVEGPSVAALQATFAENWLETCGEVLTGSEYFPPPISCDVANTALVVNSTPSSGGSSRARILFQLLLASATRSIHITTPYFLPDRSMRDELVRAIKDRGVEVTLLVPGKRSDHLLTRSSSRLAYGALLKAGAKIFEYQPAMIHAKVLLVDGTWAVVGSTNFDNRSFGLNDEVNLAVRDSSFVERLEHDFVNDLAQSEVITYERWRRRPVLQRAPEMLGWVLEREQ